MNVTRSFVVWSALLLIGGPPLAAVDAPPAPSVALVQRAEKIVAVLTLPDPAQATRVRDVVARQYADLGQIHDALAESLKTQGKEKASDRTALDAATKAARDSAQLQLWDLHAAYLGRLAAELTPAQIDQIKDGMTYGVLPLTFRVYQQMLPQLTAAQKAQLFAWLTEAREHAMDAGSSDAKHAWFGKYKGKINNYLSAAGYTMKDAEKNLKANP